MKTDNRYVREDDVIKNINESGLLVGNNAEWAKEAVYKADGIFLDYFIPVSKADDLVKLYREKIEAESDPVKIDLYREFIANLRGMNPEVD